MVLNNEGWSNGKTFRVIPSICDGVSAVFEMDISIERKETFAGVRRSKDS